MELDLISCILSHREPKWLQRSNAHMITMISVSKDELKALQTTKQTTHCTNCLFSCLCVPNKQQSSTLLYLPYGHVAYILWKLLLGLIFVGWSWTYLHSKLTGAAEKRGRGHIPPFGSPWRLILYHSRSLIDEFPTGNRESNPRCHP
jgi:hypothetical protein